MKDKKKDRSAVSASALLLPLVVPRRFVPVAPVPPSATPGGHTDSRRVRPPSVLLASAADAVCRRPRRRHVLMVRKRIIATDDPQQQPRIVLFLQQQLPAQPLHLLEPAGANCCRGVGS